MVIDMNKILLFSSLVLGGLAGGYAMCRHWQNRWFKINAPYGKKLGYPDCCIKAFCDQPPELLKITGANDKDRLRYKAACINGEYTGFIPCYEHAKRIMDGEITLESLIKNRSEEFEPFPNL